MTPPNRLSQPTPSKIGLLGDLHGDTHEALRAAREMRDRGITDLLQLGDFGFLNSRLELSNLRWLSDGLSENGQTLYFVDGNHENFDELYKFPVEADGVRWVTSEVGHLPRGSRRVVGHSTTLAALGGANSVDAWRGCWEQEAITTDDLVALGNDRVDILIGHDAPLEVPTLDAYLSATSYRWPSSGLSYAAAGRAKFHQGFLQVRPRLYVGSHYNHFIDEQVLYEADRATFTTRVVQLDAVGSPGGTSRAILDVATLDLEFFDDRTPGLRK